MESFRRIGFLRSEPLPMPINSWSDLLPTVLRNSTGHTRELKQRDIPSALRDVLGAETEEVQSAMHWWVLVTAHGSTEVRISLTTVGSPYFPSRLVWIDCAHPRRLPRHQSTFSPRFYPRD